MSGQEVSQVVHELAVETRKLLKKQNQQNPIIEISAEDGERLCSDLAWWGDFLQKKYGYKAGDIRRIIREKLTISV